MNSKITPRPRSMLREFRLADFFTLANGACGLIAIFIALSVVSGDTFPSIYVAAGLIPVALVFDFLDGRVARFRHEASELGRELDSLGDLISFGVAPAVIAHACGLDTVIDQVVLVFFALCGLSRLARFNVTAAAEVDPNNKADYLQGTPITTSIVPLAIVVIAYANRPIRESQFGIATFHWPVLFFALSGCLMVSTRLKVPKI
jgi:CDP-diacylglycerol--serine O-phosphatidyltransferase